MIDRRARALLWTCEQCGALLLSREFRGEEGVRSGCDLLSPRVASRVASRDRFARVAGSKRILNHIARRMQSSPPVCYSADGEYQSFAVKGIVSSAARLVHGLCTVPECLPPFSPVLRSASEQPCTSLSCLCPK